MVKRNEYFLEFLNKKLREYEFDFNDFIKAGGFNVQLRLAPNILKAESWHPYKKINTNQSS